MYIFTHGDSHVVTSFLNYIFNESSRFRVNAYLKDLSMDPIQVLHRDARIVVFRDEVLESSHVGFDVGSHLYRLSYEPIILDVGCELLEVIASCLVFSDTLFNRGEVG